MHINTHEHTTTIYESQYIKNRATCVYVRSARARCQVCAQKVQKRRRILVSFSLEVEIKRRVPRNEGPVVREDRQRAVGVDESGSGVSTPLIPNDDDGIEAPRDKTISGNGKREERETTATTSCARVYFRSCPGAACSTVIGCLFKERKRETAKIKMKTKRTIATRMQILS